MENTKQQKKTKQQQHTSFVNDHLFNVLAETRYVQKKHMKKVAVKKSKEVNLFQESELIYSSSGLNLHPEFLAFYMTMKADCAKKLLLYILFHVVDLKTCHFPFTDHIIQEFNDYCKRVTGVTYKPDVVKQAVRDVVAANLAISVKRKEYMLNPLIVSVNQRDHWSLINAYTTELMRKRLDVDDHLFPRYA
jgi:hypothetical protein